MAATTKKPKGLVANGIELVLTVAVAVGLALLIQAFLVKPYRIPSGSMIPTLSRSASGSWSTDLTRIRALVTSSSSILPSARRRATRERLR